MDAPPAEPITPSPMVAAIRSSFAEPAVVMSAVAAVATREAARTHRVLLNPMRSPPMASWKASKGWVMEKLRRVWNPPIVPAQRLRGRSWPVRESAETILWE